MYPAPKHFEWFKVYLSRRARLANVVDQCGRPVGKYKGPKSGDVGVLLGGVEVTPVAPSSFCLLAPLSPDRKTDETAEV